VNDREIDRGTIIAFADKMRTGILEDERSAIDEIWWT